MEYEAQVRWHK